MSDERNDDLKEFIKSTARNEFQEYIQNKRYEWCNGWLDREEFNDYQRKFGKKHRELMKSLKDELSAEDIEKINDFYHNCPDGYVVDHIVPVSRGGKHVLSNLQYLTPHENMSKNNRTPEEYKKLLERFDNIDG